MYYIIYNAVLHVWRHELDMALGGLVLCLSNLSNTFLLFCNDNFKSLGGAVAEKLNHFHLP